MGIVLDLMGALRRRAGGTLSSALERQNQQLEGNVVTSRERNTMVGIDGQAVTALIATTEPTPERVTQPTSEALRALEENVALGPAFLATFGANQGAAWTLDDLDLGFANWQTASDRQGFSDGFVEEVLGAMFGDICNRRLNMQWALLEDADGVSLIVEGVESEFRCFPFAMIRKRIDDSEAGFFRAVFTVLEHQVGEARLR